MGTDGTVVVVDEEVDVDGDVEVDVDEEVDVASVVVAAVVCGKVVEVLGDEVVGAAVGGGAVVATSEVVVACVVGATGCVGGTDARATAEIDETTIAAPNTISSERRCWVTGHLFPRRPGRRSGSCGHGSQRRMAMTVLS